MFWEFRSLPELTPFRTGESVRLGRAFMFRDGERVHALGAPLAGPLSENASCGVAGTGFLTQRLLTPRGGMAAPPPRPAPAMM